MHRRAKRRKVLKNAGTRRFAGAACAMASTAPSRAVHSGCDSQRRASATAKGSPGPRARQCRRGAAAAALGAGGGGGRAPVGTMFCSAASAARRTRASELERRESTHWTCAREREIRIKSSGCRVSAPLPLAATVQRSVAREAATREKGCATGRGWAGHRSAVAFGDDARNRPHRALAGALALPLEHRHNTVEQAAPGTPASQRRPANHFQTGSLSGPPGASRRPPHLRSRGSRGRGRGAAAAVALIATERPREEGRRGTSGPAQAASRAPPRRASARPTPCSAAAASSPRSHSAAVPRALRPAASEAEGVRPLTPPPRSRRLPRRRVAPRAERRRYTVRVPGVCPPTCVLAG